MNKRNRITRKLIAVAAVAIGAMLVGGCVAVPDYGYGTGYYGYNGGYASVTTYRSSLPWYSYGHSGHLRNRVLSPRHHITRRRSHKGLHNFHRRMPHHAGHAHSDWNGHRRR